MAKAQVLKPVYEKRKALQREVADLAKTRDREKKATAEAQEAHRDVKERTEGLEKLIDGLVEDANQALKVLEDIIGATARTSQIAKDALEEAKATLRSFEAQIERETAKLGEIRGKQKRRLAEIDRENAAVAVKQRDVEIMVDRIRKRAKELGVPANI